MISALLISLIFLSFFIFVYLNQERSNNITKAKVPVGIIFVIIIAAIIKLVLAPHFKGFQTDLSTYISWMSKAAQGLNGFYAEDYFCDYPPLFIMLLGFVGFIRNLLFHEPSFNVSVFFVKMIGIIFDALVAYELLRLYVQRFKKSTHLLFTVFLLLLPSVIFNSTVWGQTDSVAVYFLLLTFRMALDDKLELTALFFTISALMKPQSFLFAPIIAVIFLKSDKVIFIKNSEKLFGLGKYAKVFLNMALTFLSALALMAVVMIPFRNGVPDLPFLISKYTETFSSYRYASLNIFNLFNMLGGNFVSVDNNFLFLSYSVWSNIFIFVSIALAGIAVYFNKDKDKIYLIAAVYLMAVVMLGAKMHERYWYAVMIFGFVYYTLSGNKKMFSVFTVLSISYFLNLYYALLLLDGQKHPSLELLMTVFSLLNLSVLVYLIYCIYNSIREQYKDSAFFTKNKSIIEYKNYKLRTDIIFVSVLTLVYGAMAFYNLGSTKMPQTFVNLNKGDSIVFSLSEPQEITDIKYFIGHGLRTYLLSYSEDGENYTPVPVDGDKTEYQPYVFTWQHNKLSNVTAKYFKMDYLDSSRDNTSFFGDVAIYSPDDANPISYQAEIKSRKQENVAYLSDEYDMVPELASFENSFYFDEIYHARTAYEYINGLPVYETTHPPLGKLIISLGISVFGVNMFGFRFMGVLAGIILIPVFFLLARRIFKNSLTAYFTTFIYTFDFMHLSHSRIASIDIFVVLFVVAAYYFMLLFYESYADNGIKSKVLVFLGLAGIFFGCATAVKWTGVYAGLGLLVIYIAALVKAFKINKKLILPILGWSVLLFAVVPSLVYYASYFNYFVGFGKEFNFSNFWEAQLSIFDYHAGLTATHPFSSPWYEWIINFRPIWLFSQSGLPEGSSYTKTIATFGNLLVIWGGLAALIYMLCKACKEKFAKFDTISLFVFSGFFAQLLPWVFVSRATFIYHYFPMIPFIAIAIGYYVEKNIIEKGKKFELAACFACLVFVLFIMYYPVLTGNPVDTNYLNWLKILPKWSF